MQLPARHAQPGRRGTIVGPLVEVQCIAGNLYCLEKRWKPPPWIEAPAAAVDPSGQTAYNRMDGYLG